MQERHAREQYFFDRRTVSHLANFASRFDLPCCLCAPMVGEALGAMGVRARVLDVDERFAHVAGFRPYDVYRPAETGEKYGLVLVDPPFTIVSLSQLFRAVKSIARNDVRQPLLVAYPASRAANLLATFAPFGLGPTGYRPGYVSVQTLAEDPIEFFGNLTPEQNEALASAGP